MQEGKKSHGFISVLAALFGNGLITVLKFVGFFLSGSGALFSEAVHSAADLSNQALLMVGINRSTRKATKEYAYGFRKERFFRAVISACGIFFIGAGVTTYHGILTLFEGNEIIINNIILRILGISFIIESVTFFIAVKELIKANPDKSFKNMLRHGDPVTLAVVYEDGIAVLGVILASASVILYRVTGNAIRDSIGSISIGLLLGAMAIFLIIKNKKFLIGKAIPDHLRRDIIEMMEEEEIIEKVLDFKSNILDLDTYHIKCEIECNGTGLIKTIGRDHFLRKEYEKVKQNYQNFVEFCIDYTRRVPRVIGTHIDKLEAKIKARFPQIKHIDIEIN